MESKVYRGQEEDRFTGAIEAQTSRIPSTGFLAAALGAFGGAILLKFLDQEDWAVLVGQWAPALLIMGLYNKVVKQHGSDVYTKAA
jgi:hypothetical protein